MGIRPTVLPGAALGLPSLASASSSRRHLNTVNQDEIAHFSRLSEHWWDEGGEFGLLHRMNPARVQYIREKVAMDTSDEPEWTFAGRHEDRARADARGAGRWLTGLKCLDVGCGGGLLAEVGFASERRRAGECSSASH
jgi:2-polyprenyl-6-hydroxyphenyl methylase/3-demethylubiquinone-9 3-methyltransferase